MNRCKNPQQNINKPNSTINHTPWITHHDQVGFIPGIKGWFNSINVVHHINKIRKKKSYNYLNRCRKSIQQNLTSIYDKNSPQSRYKGNIPQDNEGHIQ